MQHTNEVPLNWYHSTNERDSEGGTRAQPPPPYRKKEERMMPIVLDEHGTVLVPWSELGTARPEPAPQSCDKCGKVCEEVPPERHGLFRACATE